MKKPNLAKVLDREEAELERIRALEGALHQQAAKIVEYTLRAPEIDPSKDEIPAAWLNTMTRDDAERAFRIARAAWASQKDSPAFLKTASNFLATSMKIRSNEQGGPKVLNATIVQVTQPLPQFPERIVKNDDE